MPPWARGIADCPSQVEIPVTEQSEPQVRKFWPRPALRAGVAAAGVSPARAQGLGGRYAARPLVRSRAAKNLRFQRIDQGAVAHGSPKALLARLAPLFLCSPQSNAYGSGGIDYPTYALDDANGRAGEQNNNDNRRGKG